MTTLLVILTLLIFQKICSLIDVCLTLSHSDLSLVIIQLIFLSFYYLFYFSPFVILLLSIVWGWPAVIG